MILHMCFNHKEEGFSYKQVVFKTLASLPQSAANINETPELQYWQQVVTFLLLFAAFNLR